MKLKLMMPAIYKLTRWSANEANVQVPKARIWGWHRVDDLIEVVNNIREEKGLSPLTPQQMGETYLLKDLPIDQEAIPEARSWCHPLCFAMEDPSDGTFYPTLMNCHPTFWLHHLKEDYKWCKDKFVPAGVGMALIKMVKA